MQKNKGFTLVELLAIIVIIGVLAVIIAPAINNSSSSARHVLSDAKKNTILSAAEKYGNANINDFQKCIGNSKEEVKSCVTPISNLVSNLLNTGYLNGNLDTFIINPETNQEFDGEVLFCYQQNSVSVKTQYLDAGGSKDYSCPGSGINYLNIINNTSTIYVNNNEHVSTYLDVFSINEISSFTYDYTNESDKDVIKFEYKKDENKIDIDISPQVTSGKHKFKAIAHLKDEKTSSVNFVLNIEKVDFDFYREDFENNIIYLKKGDIKTISFSGNNYGNLNISKQAVNVTSNISSTELVVRAREVGKDYLEIVESKAKTKLSLTIYVYDFNIISELPKGMILNEKSDFAFETNNITSIDITSNDLLSIDGSNNVYSVTALSNGEGTVTVKGYCGEYNCFTEEYKTDIEEFKLIIPDDDVNLYIDGENYSGEIITDNVDKLYCKSRNEEVVSCLIDNNVLSLTQHGKTGNTAVEVGLEGIYYKTVRVSVLEVEMKIEYSNNKMPDVVCRDYRKSYNDSTINVSGENIGDLSLKDVDNDSLCLTNILFQNNNIFISPNNDVMNYATINNITCSNYIKNSDNTGKANINIIESNNDLSASFEYRIYSLEMDKSDRVINVGDTTTFDIEYSYLGDDTDESPYVPDIRAERASIVSLAISDPIMVSGTKGDRANLKYKVSVTISGVSAGITDILINGSHCGHEEIRVKVIGGLMCPEVYSYDGVYDGEVKTIVITESDDNGEDVFTLNGEEYRVMPPFVNDVGVYEIDVRVEPKDETYSMINCTRAFIDIRNARIEFKNASLNGTGVLSGLDTMYTKLGENVYYENEYSSSVINNSNYPIIRQTGYNFLGWFDSEEGGNLILDNYLNIIPNTNYTNENSRWTITNNISLFGKTEKQRYTLKFSANGGSDAPEDMTIIFGEEYQMPNTIPKRDGYNFVGWSVNKNSLTAEYGPNSYGDIYEDKTLYAVWDIITYTCNINYRYQNPDGSYPSTYTNKVNTPVSYGTACETVIGDDVTYVKTKVSKLNENVNISLDIPRKQYTLTITKNNTYISSFAPASGSKFMVGQTVSISATPSSNSRFTGWSQTLGNTITFNDFSSASTTFVMPSSDVSIYANGELNGYTITFEFDSYISSIVVKDPDNDSTVGTVTQSNKSLDLQTKKSYSINPIFTDNRFELNKMTVTGSGTVSGNIFTVGTANATVNVTSKSDVISKAIISVNRVVQFHMGGVGSNGSYNPARAMSDQVYAEGINAVNSSSINSTFSYTSNSITSYTSQHERCLFAYWSVKLEFIDSRRQNLNVYYNNNPSYNIVLNSYFTYSGGGGTSSFGSYFGVLTNMTLGWSSGTMNISYPQSGGNSGFIKSGVSSGGATSVSMTFNSITVNGSNYPVIVEIENGAW